MKGTGAKRNVCRGSCASTGAKFPVAPVESAPMLSTAEYGLNSKTLGRPKHNYHIPPNSNAKQVCVQLSTSAVNVTLLAFAVESRTAASVPSLLINIFRSHGAEQQTCRSCGRTRRLTDRRMDTKSFYRPCTAYYVSSVNNKCSIIRHLQTNCYC